ncbi:MAG TPA: ABC transporter substrate-binding protein [Burkholderiaceae bacterium]|nr:ABC transporter substrate-binding protein [Burkholderiaceae bacterium]
MRRRTGLLAVASLAAPWLASAQAKMPRVGVLSPGTQSPGLLADARAQWKRLGWSDGETLLTIWRHAAFNADRMSELASDLLQRHSVDLLMAIGPEAAVAAARATRTVPLVFVWGYLPVESGLVESYSRPGRNATGIALSDGLDVSNKRIEFLRAVAPAARRLAIVGPNFGDYAVSGELLDLPKKGVATAHAHGFDATVHTARRVDEVDAALLEAAAARAQVVLISGAAYSGAAARVVEFALHQGWVSSTLSVDLLDAGLLMYYGPSQREHQRIWARGFEIADRILRGAKPADMPVELPTRYELALNLKTARALDLKLPQAISMRADRVIE